MIFEIDIWLIFDTIELGMVIEELTDLLTNNQPSGFSHHPIRIELTCERLDGWSYFLIDILASTVPDLTLIDLPGFLKISFIHFTISHLFTISYTYLPSHLFTIS